MNGPVYNSHNPEMNFPSSRVRWVLCLCVLFSHLSFATDWHQPVSEIAGKIATLTGPGVVALEINNRSSIGSADVEEIRRELTSALGTAGVRVWQPDQAGATIKLTLSENLQNYVWVAQIRQASDQNGIILVSSPRTESATVQQKNVPPLTLRATSLISQPEAILDVAVLAGMPQRILVLGRDAVTLQELQSGRWALLQSLAISSPNPLPRDARGQIILGKDHLFDAYLPGLICHSNNSTPLTMNCTPSDDPWPLGTETFGVSAFFSPARNFFTGALVPGIGKQKSAPSFYSAAALPRSNYVLWVFAGLDGQVHLLDGFNQQLLTRVHWGSDIAAVHATCRPDWQVLADIADSETADSLQLFEFADREPAAASPKLALNGRITALRAAPGGENAIAVYQNSNTGNYEAVQVDFDCAR
jgi:hypothetical protein